MIGRLRIQGAEPASPRIRRIAVLDLTPETKGNAYGIGLADFTNVLRPNLTGNLFCKCPYQYLCPTGYAAHGAARRRAVLRAVKSLGLASLREARIIRIKNTLHLQKCWFLKVYKHLELPAIRLLQQPSSLQFSRKVTCPLNEPLNKPHPDCQPSFCYMSR